MSEIGRSLVFYMQYQAEMDTLYENEQKLEALEQRPDAEDIKRKIDLVGQQAGKVAADLLEECVSGWRREIESARVARLRPNRRSTVERNWDFEIDIFPPRGKITTTVNRQIGVYVDPTGLQPWIWSRGGRAAEHRIRELLPGSECRGSKVMDWYGGSVALPLTAIPWHDAVDFRLDRDQPVLAVQRTLASLTPDFIRQFFEAA